MLGLAHTLVAENLHDRAFINRYTVGFERFRAYLMGESDGVAKFAQWAAGISALDAKTIVELARRMARSRTMIAPSWSIQRSDHGEQPFWMTIVLAAMLGQIGLPGGGFLVLAMALPRRWVIRVARCRLPNCARASRATINSYIPVSRLTDMLLRPGQAYDFNGQKLHYPDIKLVYWAGGNPFHHHQDLNRLSDSWRRQR